MAETRRGAVRLTHGGPGELRFKDRSAPCVVLDVSVTGALVRLDPPTLIPHRVTLAGRLGGRTFEAPGTVRRSQAGSLVALVFDDGDAAGLGRLIANEQRQRLSRRKRAAPPARPG